MSELEEDPSATESRFVTARGSACMRNILPRERSVTN